MLRLSPPSMCCRLSWKWASRVHSDLKPREGCCSYLIQDLILKAGESTAKINEIYLETSRESNKSPLFCSWVKIFMSACNRHRIHLWKMSILEMAQSIAEGRIIYCPASPALSAQVTQFKQICTDCQMSDCCSWQLTSYKPAPVCKMSCLISTVLVPGLTAPKLGLSAMALWLSSSACRGAHVSISASAQLLCAWIISYQKRW